MSEFNINDINNENLEASSDAQQTNEGLAAAEDIAEAQQEHLGDIAEAIEEHAENVGEAAENAEEHTEEVIEEAREAVEEQAEAAEEVYRSAETAQSYTAPYPQQSEQYQQNPAYGQSYQPYQQQYQPYQQQYQGYQQPSQGYYHPQTNEYVYAPQPPKKKSNVGKALIITIVSLLSVFVISIAAVSAYVYVNNGRLGYQPYTNTEKKTSKVPLDEHEFRNDAEEEIVGDDRNDEIEEAADEVNISHTPKRDAPTLEQLAAPEDALALPDIYDKVSESVVGVSCYVGRSVQTGTGFIISDDGYIVTNAHVIENYTSVMIVDEDLNEFEAEVIGYDTQTDIAVLKIDPSGKDLVPVEFGKSDELRIGELAIAIGNPLGFDLYGTMTTGIISGLDRTVTIGDNTMNLLQTSASINRGNSGGPLIDAYGRVIGITSAKIDSTYGESLGFAIPIDEALPIVTNLIEYGYVTGRPSIGISGQDVTELISAFYRIPQGVLVYSVSEGSGAEAAGIQPEDVIIGIQGETITNMNELNAIKNQYKVGDTVTLTIYRSYRSDWGTSEGQSFDVEVVLTEAAPE